MGGWVVVGIDGKSCPLRPITHLGFSHRSECGNFGQQGSVIDGILAGLKSRRKYVNFKLQGSVIEGEKMHSQGRFSTRYKQA